VIATLEILGNYNTFILALIKNYTADVFRLLAFENNQGRLRLGLGSKRVCYIRPLQFKKYSYFTHDGFSKWFYLVVSPRGETNVVK